IRDREGALWVATQDGLLRQKDGVAKKFTTGDGLVSDRLTRVLEDAEGNLWVGTDEGLHRYVDGRFAYYPLGGTDPEFITALCRDKEGSLWVGTRSQGLTRLRQG